MPSIASYKLFPAMSMLTILINLVILHLSGNYALALQMVKKQQLIPYIKNSGDAGPNRQHQQGFGTIGSGLPSSGFQPGGGIRGIFPSSAAPGSNKPMRAKDPWAHN